MGDVTAAGIGVPSPTVHVHVSGAVAVIGVDNPPVNALSHSVRAGLLRAIHSLSVAPTISSIVILGQRSTFPAGADIREFGQPIAEPTINDVNQAIESCPKPVVAAMHGTALGGGLEVAMACHYRIAAASARLGLPEVRLGVIPGAGGTQRLPRLIGSTRALSAIARSELIDAGEACELGLVDEIADGALEDCAVARAQQLVNERRSLRLARHRHEKLEQLESRTIAELRASLSPQQQRSLAVSKATECVQNAAVLSFDEALRRERECVEQCKASPQAAALQHLFFAERAAARWDGEGARGSPSAPTAIGLVGTGPLRLDLAAMIIGAGTPVVVLEPDPALLASVTAEVRTRMERKRSPGARAAIRSHCAIEEGLRGATLEEMHDLPVVIEVEPDLPGRKVAAVVTLRRHLAADAIIVTTTALGSVSQVAAASERPSNVIGMHFFVPACVMRLVEVVRGDCSSAEATSLAIHLARRLGKVPVVVRDGDGFVGDRTLRAYLRAAFALAREGVAVAVIDAAMREFGMTKGPFEVCRLVGSDLAEAILVGQRTPAHPDAATYAAILRQILESPSMPACDPVSPELARTIVHRCLRAASDEGRRALEEGIVARPGDIDVVWVHGLGFPPDHGGPMFWSQRQEDGSRAHTSLAPGNHPGNRSDTATRGRDV